MVLYLLMCTKITFVKCWTQNYLFSPFYSIWEPNTDPSAGLYCSHTLYLFAFVVMLTYYGLVLLALLTPVAALFFLTVYSSNKKIESTKGLVQGSNQDGEAPDFQVRTG